MLVSYCQEGSLPFSAPLNWPLVKLSLIHFYLPSCDYKMLGWCHHLTQKMFLMILSHHLDTGNHSHNSSGNCSQLLVPAVVGSDGSCCCTAVAFCCCCCWSSCRGSGMLLLLDTDGFVDSR